MNCAGCGQPLSLQFCDLGFQPPSNSFISKENICQPEKTYPLAAYTCTNCWLTQLAYDVNAYDIFDDNYVYYSSDSQSNVDHAHKYADYLISLLGLNNKSNVLEIGCNDGYLLQWFRKAGIDVLGVDPADGPALAAQKQDIPVVIDFFGSELANELPQFNLICGINVLAHQSNIHDFIEGLRICLAPEGTISFEFPWLSSLINHNQFDTIYHEHYFYFSLTSVASLFEGHGLQIYNASFLNTHGGSLRILACHKDCKKWEPLTISDGLALEKEQGICNYRIYSNFQKEVDGARHEFLDFIHTANSIHETVVGYGAAAKGNTFLNFCKMDKSFIPFVVDISKHKQGKYLPGSHIPVVDETSGIKEICPEYILILPWNIKDVITRQLAYVIKWKGKFVTAIPQLKVF